MFTRFIRITCESKDTPADEKYEAAFRLYSIAQAYNWTLPNLVDHVPETIVERCCDCVGTGFGAKWCSGIERYPKPMWPGFPALSWEMVKKNWRLQQWLNEALPITKEGKHLCPIMNPLLWSLGSAFNDESA